MAASKWLRRSHLTNITHASLASKSLNELNAVESSTWLVGAEDALDAGEEPLAPGGDAPVVDGPEPVHVDAGDEPAVDEVGGAADLVGVGAAEHVLVELSQPRKVLPRRHGLDLGLALLLQPFRPLRRSPFDPEIEM